MDDTKTELITNIKEWIQTDNELKILQKEIKNRREKKKKITSELVEIMKKNEIDDINIKNGKIVYTRNKIKAPLSKKHLISCLMKFYNNDKEQAYNMSQYILDSREVKYKEGIRRKINKMDQENLLNRLE